MAKWGQGDPRWIVEERPDATNVNNWHWTEKNAGPWSQERIRQLFKNVKVQTDLADVNIKDVEKCEGEASANNRKGKLIFFYEWNLVLNWEGKLHADDSTKQKGTITVPNLSEENDVSELDVSCGITSKFCDKLSTGRLIDLNRKSLFQIQISVKDDNEQSDVLKQIMQNEGRNVVRQQLQKYIKELKEEFSKGMILPRKGEEIKPDSIKNLTSGFNKKVNMEPIVNNQQQQLGLKLDVGTISQTQQFQCRAMEFYDAMTKIELVTAFTRDAAQLEPVKGGKFQLFGGNITGVFEELVPGKKIVQRWRYKQWPEGHYSTVTLDINEKVSLK